jgi:hypothetical protein
MSSGPFVRSKYAINPANTPNLTEDVICPIRVQPETLSLTLNSVTNDAPTGDVNLEVSVRARKNRQQYGMGARNVVIAWTTAPPTGYADENLTVPVLQRTVFDQYSVGQEGTYLGTACILVSKTTENLT